MVGALDEGKITEYFRNKSVLITGSTGFLGKSMIIHTLVFCRTNTCIVCSSVCSCSPGGEDPEGAAGRQEDLPPGARGGRGGGQAKGRDRGPYLSVHDCSSIVI
jgi:hypothetical protein